MKYNLELIKNKRKIISFSTFLILLSLLGILYSTFNTSYKKPINLGMDFVGGNNQPGYFKQNLKVYGREGENCYDCSFPIKGQRIGQRASAYCPNCQSNF